MSPQANRYRPGARQRGEDTSRRILETALALFAAEGFDSASTRAIAEQAGVNLPAIQYYFGSKEGLYRAAIAHIGEQATQAIAPISARVRNALDSGTPNRAQLIGLLCEMVDALVTMFLDETLPGRESRSLFVSRVEVEHTAALDPLNDVMRELVMTPTSVLVGRLVGRPPDDEQVVLRTLMILGQAKIFCSRSVVRALGWETIGEGRIDAVKALVHQHTRAICRSLASAATRDNARSGSLPPRAFKDAARQDAASKRAPVKSADARSAAPKNATPKRAIAQSCSRQACGGEARDAMIRHSHAGFVALLMLTSCAVGPDFLRPAAPEVDGYTPEKLADPGATSGTQAGGAQHFDVGQAIQGEWWTLFHSPPLDQLVQRALRANPDIDAAQAALRQARENLYAGQGALFPSASASFQPERERLSGAEFGTPGNSTTFSLVTAQLNVSYAPDVFGGTRRQIELLRAQAEYQRFELEATYLTLTSNLVVAAVNEASLRGQITATEQIIKAEADQLAVVRQQFDAGGASGADLLTQQATVAQSRATLPPLRKQLAQQRDQLIALVGGFPNEALDASFDLAGLNLPDDLPLSLPSQLVEQRPDVRAAEAQFHAASANLGVAVANQLPQFSITGSVGSVALGFTNLFTPATGVWSIVGGVTQTLFDAGTLLHKKRAAAAALEQAAAQYRSTVIKAFQNVADSLRALQFDADTLREQAAAEKAASDSLALATAQYQAGGISYLTLLNADRTAQQARLSLVQAEAARFADTAALFQALGGGWWQRTDVATETNGPDHLTPPLAAALQN